MCVVHDRPLKENSCNVYFSVLLKRNRRTHHRKRFAKPCKLPYTQHFPKLFIQFVTHFAVKNLIQNVFYNSAWTLFLNCVVSVSRKKRSSAYKRYLISVITWNTAKRLRVHFAIYHKSDTNIMFHEILQQKQMLASYAV